jgi:hypothetical protein
MMVKGFFTGGRTPLAVYDGEDARLVIANIKRVFFEA